MDKGITMEIEVCLVSR